jgi:hypothetical protein
MSISLKVVNEAFVFWDSFKRRAMVWRILFIATLVSRRDPVISDGAFFEITLVKLGELDATGVGAAVGVAAAGTGFAATGVAGVAGAALTGSAV